LGRHGLIGLEPLIAVPASEIAGRGYAVGEVFGHHLRLNITCFAHLELLLVTNLTKVAYLASIAGVAGIVALAGKTGITLPTFLGVVTSVA
jgi:hypothetical protein